MNKIIIPGQEEKQKREHIYQNIREYVNAKWDDQDLLQEHFNKFLSAIQQGATKEYQYNSELEFMRAGSPIWNEHSTFDEWMRDTELMYEFRLKELKQRKEDSTKSFPHIIKLINQAKDAGQVSGMPEGIGEELKPEDYEIFEFIIRKSLEVVRNFRHGRIDMKKPQIDSEEQKRIDALAKKIINF